MDLATRRRTFIERLLGRLATSLGFHPVAIGFPELAPYGQLGDHVLVREHPDGYRQMIVPVACDAAAQLVEDADRVERFANEHAALTADMKLRIVCVYIAGGGLTRAERRHLKPTRMLDDHVVIRRFWLSLDHRRMFAAFSPWGFAPSFEVNPCDPDENLFVSLVRKDRYLKTAPEPPVTEEVHRRSLAHERTFLAGLARRNLLVWTLLALNVLVWLVLESTGGSRNPAQLIRAGAKSNGLIRAGQTWRLVTPIFLHYGLLHLVLNSAGLLFLGEVLERIYGTRQFALLYFASGIVSVLASTWFGGALMVGASGAIFGLAGTLAVYGYRYRHRIPRRYSAMFGGGILPLIGINVLFGFMVNGIDNSAHLGGLLAGTAVTLLLKPLADERSRGLHLSLRDVVALALAGVVLGALLAGAVFFVRFDNIYETDTRWMLREEVPGDVVLLVPASWVRADGGMHAVSFQSVGYTAHVDARALDTSQGLSRALKSELGRIGTRGFRPPGPTRPREHIDAVATGRYYRIRMVGPEGWEREEVLIWFKDTHTLVSIGVEIPQARKLAFAPVQERMLSLLPVLRPTKP